MSDSRPPLVRLGDLVEFKYGEALTAAQRSGSGYPVYGSGGVSGYHETALVKGPGLVVGRKGSIGAVFLESGPFWPIDTTYFVDEWTDVLPAYLFYFLRSLDLSALNRSTAIPGINRNDLYSLEIPLPPADEQRRIVARIEEAMERVRRSREALAKVPSLAASQWKGALFQAFRGEYSMGMRSPGDEEQSAHELRERLASYKATTARGVVADKKTAEKPEGSLPRIPEGWQWARLGDLAADEPYALTDGPFGSNLKTADYVSEGARVIRLGNIGDGFFVEDDVAYVSMSKYESLKKHEARPDDLVIAALAEPVARACQVPRGLGPAIVKADCIRLRPHPLINGTYLMHAINEPGTHRRIEAVAHGVGRLRINLGELRSSWIPVAPRVEQDAIVKRLEHVRQSLENCHNAVRKSTDSLDQLESAILTAAFKGNL